MTHSTGGTATAASTHSRNKHAADSHVCSCAHTCNVSLDIIGGLRPFNIRVLAPSQSQTGLTKNKPCAPFQNPATIELIRGLPCRPLQHIVLQRGICVCVVHSCQCSVRYAAATSNAESKQAMGLLRRLFCLHVLINSQKFKIQPQLTHISSLTRHSPRLDTQQAAPTPSPTLCATHISSLTHGFSWMMDMRSSSDSRSVEVRDAYLSSRNLVQPVCVRGGGGIGRV
jgi:hypothetical protein